MRVGVLFAVLLCGASGLSAQEAAVAPLTECDTCQARHRGLQSLQAARAGAARAGAARPSADRAITPPATRPPLTVPRVGSDLTAPDSGMGRASGPRR